MNSPLRLITSAVVLLAAGCSTSPKAQSTDERRADVYLESGIQSLEQHDYTAALRSLNEAVKYAPKSSIAWTDLGIAYMGKGEAGRAEESWRKALQVDPTHDDARLNLGILYVNKKRFPEAERTLKDAAKDLSYSKLHQVAYTLATAYLAQNKPLLAEQQLKIAVRENATFCPAWLQLGQLQKERGDYAEAAESLKGSVMGTCYKNPKAHYEIATLYLKAHEITRAKSKLLEIIQLFPSSEWASKSEATLNMIR